MNTNKNLKVSILKRNKFKFIYFCIVILCIIIGCVFRYESVQEVKAKIIEICDYDFDGTKVNYINSAVKSTEDICSNKQKCSSFDLYLTNSNGEQELLIVKYLYSFEYIDSVILYRKSEIKRLYPK